MAKEQQTVPNIFRRAQKLRSENQQLSYKDLTARLLDEYQGAPLPPVYNLTIPEQDARAPEEDWSAGLSIVLRGIQREDWKEIVSGIVLCLEQTENYDKARGGATGDTWHDRTIGIKDPLTKGVGKWMPEDLARLAERSSKKQ